MADASASVDYHVDCGCCVVADSFHAEAIVSAVASGQGRSAVANVLAKISAEQLTPAHHGLAKGLHSVKQVAWDAPLVFADGVLDHAVDDLSGFVFVGFACVPDPMAVEELATVDWAVAVSVVALFAFLVFFAFALVLITLVCTVA